ncbi:MAG: hypothetical protein ABSB56_04765 [Nitrososphaerales archaeon]|jgi:hypothetical protein
MRTTIKLSIRCADVDVCRNLTSVLTPDNEGAPHGMTLRMRARKETLEFQITSDFPSGVVSTAIAVLRDVLLFQEVWLLSRVRDT